MSQFELLTKEERLIVAPELNGIDCFLVRGENKVWIVKHIPGSVDMEKRDLLGYLLGKGFVNVAEVKLLKPEEIIQIRSITNRGNESDKKNTYLVRVAGSYTVNELTCNTLEKAVATELVYSTWTRRRDTHADNRVYVNGIPIFFDHHIAFLSEPKYAHITSFLQVAPDYGHPAFWRVKEVSNEITTQFARNVVPQENKAWHYVHNIKIFMDELEVAVKDLTENKSVDLSKIIESVGFDSTMANIINNFLWNNLYSLSHDVGQLKNILFINN